MPQTADDSAARRPVRAEGDAKMRLRDLLGRPEGRQGAALLVFLVVQGLAALFFLGDGIWDALHDPPSSHIVFELLVGLALVLGLVFGAFALRRTMAQLARQERALEIASGALAEVIDRQFAVWGLTPAETDVAMLALKGLDVAEIAAIRHAAPGTVRAQLTRIYAKAGVSGRAQFAAFFVEDLLGQGLAPR